MFYISYDKIAVGYISLEYDVATLGRLSLLAGGHTRISGHNCPAEVLSHGARGKHEHARALTGRYLN